jgi:uncharacterized protein YbjT (DUF2867 family)
MEVLMTNYSKAVVLGGSGLIGSRVVERLRTSGIEVLSASRRTGVDTLTGEGLDKALANADVVVDASDVHSFDQETLRKFFTVSGENVARAEAAAGVKHHVTLSIVGVDRIDGNPYYAAKLAQEEMASRSGVPFTIARSTQFYEFFPTIAGGFTKGSVVGLPNAMLQPIAADDVAVALADIALSPPKYGPVYIAGPERDPFDRWLTRVFKLTDDPRSVEVDFKATWFGATLENDSIVPKQTDYSGHLKLEEWFATPEAKRALLGDRYAEAVAAIEQGRET